MVKRLLCLLCALMLLPSGALGNALPWKQDTPAQALLRSLVECADAFLLEFGESPVNSLFEMYDGFAVFGITAMDGAELPEEVEITCRLHRDVPDTLQVRVSRAERFPAVAAAFLRAVMPDLTPEQALKDPQSRARRVLEQPDNSFEETVEELNGTSIRVYYAYFPDQYHDGVSWLQMTVVFPLAEYWDTAQLESAAAGTPAPSLPEDADPEYEGYYSRDDYSHFEVFATETPEPDSAAKEYDSVWK